MTDQPTSTAPNTNTGTQPVESPAPSNSTAVPTGGEADALLAQAYEDAGHAFFPEAGQQAATPDFMAADTEQESQEATPPVTPTQEQSVAETETETDALPRPDVAEETPEPSEPIDISTPEALERATEPYLKEIMLTGGLSEASVKDAAQKLGIAESVVQEYARLKADEVKATKGTSQNAVAMAQAYNAIGGSENWPAFERWAQQKFSAAERSAYVAADTATRAALISAYAPRFQADLKTTQAQPEGQTDNRRDVTQGSTRQTTASEQVKAFADLQEQQRAMLDPRYATDSTYRQKVMRRLLQGTRK